MCWRSQSRFPTRRVGKCVGEANLVFIFSSMYIEIATPPLREARNDKKENPLPFFSKSNILMKLIEIF
jgi:hypothetical protein